MNSSSFTFALSILLLLFFSPFLVSAFSTSPVLLWSSNSYFTQRNTQYLETVSSVELEHLFHSLLNLKDGSSINLIDRLVNEKKIPEVLLVFLEPQVRLSQLSQFSNLERLVMNTSTSSLVLPYASFSGSLVNSLGNLVTDAKAAVSDCSVVLVNEYNFVPTELNSFAASTMTFTSFMESLNNGALLKNSLNIFIINFGTKASTLLDTSATNIASDDSFIQTVDSAIRAQTENYLAIFTAKQGASSHISRRSLEETQEVQRAQQILTTSSSSELYSNYFPIPIWEAIIVSIVLLSILIVGVCCTFDLQTPQRYEVPKQRKAE